MKKITGIIIEILHNILAYVNLIVIPIILVAIKDKTQQINILNKYIILLTAIIINWILLDGECVLSIIEYYCADKPAFGPEISMQGREKIWITGVVLLILAIITRFKIQNTLIK